jgi:predicted ester cyclase
MTTPTDLERFLGWAFGFEAAFWSDDFAPLAAQLAPDAVHVVHADGSLAADDRGAAALLGGLAASVRGMDRRFDVRIPEILAGPSTRPDGVWMRYALRLRRAGLPELAFEGDHLTRYANGRIVAIEETLAPGTGVRVDAFLHAHDAALRAAGSPPAPPADPRDQRDAEAALLRSLARAYAAAKSEQDVAAALSLCSEDFVLDAVPLGIPSVDRKGAEAQLALFFAAFPDYAVSAQGLAAEGTAVACWGRARQTFRGPYLGFAPTGRSADVPFTSVFEARGGRLVRERYDFDLAGQCAQLGLPVEAVLERVARLAGARS